MIARAVSAGSRPPRSSPIGTAQPVQVLRRDTRGEEPRPPVRLRLARAHGPDVAAAARERLDDRRLVELDVVGQDRDRVGRAEADLLGDLVRPATMSRSTSGKRASVANAARPSMTTVS